MLKNAVGRTALKSAAQGSQSALTGAADGTHPNLGLHSAAASGNIGLVKFALENGQSANSNLNGIFPLHAACSGGSEQTVRMLIYHGADVNVARLKSKTSGGPGSEGSTPLHFAAANGHLEITRMLLEAGARPTAADKEGVTPVALAMGNSHPACASLIRSWISAYGSNGLAGMVSSRDTVSGDVALGPAGYIRYSAATSDPAPASPLPVTNTFSESPPTSQQVQRSYDTVPITSKQPGVRSNSTSSKPNFLTKTSSNSSLGVQDTLVATPTPTLTSSPALSSASSSRPVLAVSPVSSFSSVQPAASQQTSVPHHASESSAETAFGISTSLAGLQLPPPIVPVAPVQLRETRRRPSLPAIIGKATHPAATIRAALASGASSIDPYQTSIASPSKRANKLAGKRSLSNILRKATGSSTLSSTSPATGALSPAATYSGDVSASSASSNLSTSAGRDTGQSFEHQRQSMTDATQRLRRNTDGDGTGMDKPITAPPTQTGFKNPLWAPSEAQNPTRDFRARSASASSTLAKQHIDNALQRVGRARSIPTDQSLYQSGDELRSILTGTTLRPAAFLRNEANMSGSGGETLSPQVGGPLGDFHARHDTIQIVPSGAQSPELLSSRPVHSAMPAASAALPGELSENQSGQGNRNRSHSSLSVASSGSVSGATFDQPTRGLSTSKPLYETDQVSHVQTILPGSDHERARHPNDSSTFLGSSKLSAAEQALAILNQEDLFAADGPGGTSISLAAQLAAYGEALASERRSVGETRTGPSPNLSTRGSNTALRTKLPSVTEDQSPARAHVGDNATFGGALQDLRVPKYPATAAQSYHRRVSRRPTSSEGRESQGAARPSRHVERWSPGINDTGLPLRSDTLHTGLHTLSLDTTRSAEVEPLSGLNLAPRFQERSAEQSSSDQERNTSRDSVHCFTRVVNTEDEQEQDRREAGTDQTTLATAKEADGSANTSAQLDDPTTPVVSAHSKGFFDVDHETSKDAHRYSPSVPTELASYTALRRERSPALSLNSSSSSSSSSSAGLTGPTPPPRKGSMHSPHLSPHMSEASVSNSDMLTPDAARTSRVTMSRQSSLDGSDPQSSRWDGIRRPSISMLRSSTATSSRSHSTISHHGGAGDDSQQWSADEAGSHSGNEASNSSRRETAARGGKRRLVRNLLSNMKAS